VREEVGEILTQRATAEKSEFDQLSAINSL